MKWCWALLAIIGIAAICSRRRTAPGAEIKETVGRRKLSMCIDANIYSPTWGEELPCDDEPFEPEPGGRTSAWGPSIDPLGASSTMITYDKT